MGQWVSWCNRRQAAAEETDTCLNDYVPAASRCTVKVVVTNLAGESIVLETLPVSAPLQEVHAFVKEQWKVPPLAQQLVLGGRIVEVPPAQSVGKALGVPNGGEVELSCVRGQLPLEEQSRLDEALMLAAARGDCPEIASLLTDGARPAGPLGRAREGAPRPQDGEFATDEPSDAEGGRTPSPLLLALAAGHAEAAELLRGRGAPEPSLELSQWLPARAFSHGDFAEVVRLLAHNADPNIRLRRGQGIRDTSSGCPLHVCCAQHQRPGAAALAELLLQLNADPNSLDGEGDTPLAHARYFRAENVAAVLRAHGAKVQGPYYNTLFQGPRRLFGLQS
uniref:Ubiquitin-like domain-containing protein n=1 Tax=Alexandrium monilatum TaxID=311494 RepID=A0A7S4SFP7_9DINO